MWRYFGRTLVFLWLFIFKSFQKTSLQKFLKKLFWVFFEILIRWVIFVFSILYFHKTVKRVKRFLCCGRITNVASAMNLRYLFGKNRTTNKLPEQNQIFWKRGFSQGSMWVVGVCNVRVKWGEVCLGRIEVKSIWKRRILYCTVQTRRSALVKSQTKRRMKRKEMWSVE